MTTTDFFWFLTALEDKCPIYALKHNIESFKNDIRKGTYKDPTIDSHKFIISKEPYSQLVGAIFRENPAKGAIPILQSHGYFCKGNPNLLDNNPRPNSLLQFYECLMWAYLDTCLPKTEITKVIGRTKASCSSDAESTFCIWINALIKRHQKLQPLTTISRNFFGLPHFRVVLYHFYHDDQFLKINETPLQNATLILNKLSEIGIQTPFSVENYQQPPLVLMCFLCTIVSKLSEVIPPRPPPAITTAHVTTMLLKIEKQKKVVAEVDKRVQTLIQEVDEISDVLRHRSRPQSTLAFRMKNHIHDRHNLHEEPHLASSMRARTSLGGRKTVTWNIPEDDIHLMMQTSKHQGCDKLDPANTKK